MGVITVPLLAACGGPELGSREDLMAQVDAIDLPTTTVELDRS